MHCQNQGKVRCPSQPASGLYTCCIATQPHGHAFAGRVDSPPNKNISNNKIKNLKQIIKSHLTLLQNRRATSGGKYDTSTRQTLFGSSSLMRRTNLSMNVLKWRWARNCHITSSLPSSDHTIHTYLFNLFNCIDS